MTDIRIHRLKRVHADATSSTSTGEVDDADSHQDAKTDQSAAKNYYRYAKPLQDQLFVRFERCQGVHEGEEDARIKAAYENDDNSKGWILMVDATLG